MCRGDVYEHVSSQGTKNILNCNCDVISNSRTFGSLRCASLSNILMVYQTNFRRVVYAVMAKEAKNRPNGGGLAVKRTQCYPAYNVECNRV